MTTSEHIHHWTKKTFLSHDATRSTRWLNVNKVRGLSNVTDIPFWASVNKALWERHRSFQNSLVRYFGPVSYIVPYWRNRVSFETQPACNAVRCSQRILCHPLMLLFGCGSLHGSVSSGMDWWGDLKAEVRGGKGRGGGVGGGVSVRLTVESLLNVPPETVWHESTKVRTDRQRG